MEVKEEEKKEEPKKAGEVKEGESYQHLGIVLHILEIRLYTKFSGRKEIRVAYELIDRGHVVASAHFWMEQDKPVQPEIENIVNLYLKVKKSIR